MDQKEEDDWWRIDKSDFVKDECLFPTLPTLDLSYTDCCSNNNTYHETHRLLQFNKTETTIIRHANVINENDTTNFDGIDLPLGVTDEKLHLNSNLFDIKVGLNNNASETSDYSPLSSFPNEFSTSLTTEQSFVNEADYLSELKSYSKTRGKMHEMAVKQKLITEQDPKSFGFLHLSSEEKRTLLQEGYKLPTVLPLTKSEEDALKVLSAQESRRKRKEYVNALEKRIQYYRNESSSLKLKLKDLEQKNRGLFMQLKNLKTPMEPNCRTGDHHLSSNMFSV